MFRWLYLAREPLARYWHIYAYTDANRFTVLFWQALSGPNKLKALLGGL
jgi:hypothetical protein